MAKNEHRIQGILLNDNRGVVTVGQLNYYVEAVTGIGLKRLCGVDNKINTLNISYWLEKHTANITSYNNQIHNVLLRLQNGTSDQTTTQWINDRNTFKNNTTFIWGSIDRGGLFIYYTDSSKNIKFGCVSGLYWKLTS